VCYTLLVKAQASFSYALMGKGLLCGVTEAERFSGACFGAHPFLQGAPHGKSYHSRVYRTPRLL
jgi:hypothetical protein